MIQRLDYRDANPQAMRGMFLLEEAARHGGLEQSLLELVRMRASQINRCAYCLDMHSIGARGRCFTPRERAALAWTEALTLLSQNDVSDDLYASMNEQFSDSEIVALTIAVIAINGWNRLAIPFRTPPGSCARAGAGHPARK